MVFLNPIHWPKLGVDRLVSFVTCSLQVVFFFSLCFSSLVECYNAFIHSFPFHFQQQVVYVTD